MTDSFYDLLGVPADAAVEEIERAYRQRIKETHPDLNDDPDASEETARLVEARDVLTDESERARYDRLGHEAYVGGGFDPTVDPGAYGSASAAADAATTGSDDGPTNARASAEERRRRERRARADVDFGTGADLGGNGEARGEASGETSGDAGGRTTSSATDYGTSGARTVGSTAGGPTAAGGHRATAAGAGHARADPTEPPSWSDASDGWAARSPTSPPPRLSEQVWAAFERSPGTAIVTFLLYPLLVLGAFFPPFPLIVNLVVAACLVTTVAAAQSVPGLGVLIFGAWSGLGTLGLIGAGVSPFSPLGLLVLLTTWLPLGFSLLTFQVLDN